MVSLATSSDQYLRLPSHVITQEYTGSLLVLSEQIEATSPPVDFEATSAALTLEVEELRRQLLEKEKDEVDAIEHSEAIKIKSASHAKNIEAYNLARKTQYILDEKDRRYALKSLKSFFP